MPRDPNIPDAFDVYTIVVLRRPVEAPAMSDEELDTLQARRSATAARCPTTDAPEPFVGLGGTWREPHQWPSGHRLADPAAPR